MLPSKTAPESIPRNFPRLARPRRNPPARPLRPFRYSARDNRTGSPLCSKPPAPGKPQPRHIPPPLNHRKTWPASIPRNFPRWARRNPPAFPHSGIRTGSPSPRYPARRPRRIRIDSRRGLMSRPPGKPQPRHIPSPPNRKTWPVSAPRKFPRWERRNPPAFPHSGIRTGNPSPRRPARRLRRTRIDSRRGLMSHPPGKPQPRHIPPPLNHRKTWPVSAPRKFPRWERRNPPTEPPRPFRHSGPDNRTNSPPRSKPPARRRPQTPRIPSPPNHKTWPESNPRNFPRWARRNPPAFPHSGIRTGSPSPRRPARPPRRIRIDSRRGLMSHPPGKPQPRHIPPPLNHRKTWPVSAPRNFPRWERRNPPAFPHSGIRTGSPSPRRPARPPRRIRIDSRRGLMSPPPGKPQPRHIPPPLNHRKTWPVSAPRNFPRWERRNPPAFPHSGIRTGSPSPRRPARPPRRIRIDSQRGLMSPPPGKPQPRHIPPPLNHRKTWPVSAPRNFPRWERRNPPAFPHSGIRTGSPSPRRPARPPRRIRIDSQRGSMSPPPGKRQTRRKPSPPNRKTWPESNPRSFPRRDRHKRCPGRFFGGTGDTTPVPDEFCVITDNTIWVRAPNALSFGTLLATAVPELISGYAARAAGAVGKRSLSEGTSDANAVLDAMVGGTAIASCSIGKDSLSGRANGANSVLNNLAGGTGAADAVYNAFSSVAGAGANPPGLNGGAGAARPSSGSYVVRHLIDNALVLPRRGDIPRG